MLKFTKINKLIQSCQYSMSITTYCSSEQRNIIIISQEFIFFFALKYLKARNDIKLLDVCKSTAQS